MEDWSKKEGYMYMPRRKGTHIRTIFNRKYADFMQIFARITTQYRPKQFISGAVENKS